MKSYRAQAQKSKKKGRGKEFLSIVLAGACAVLLVAVLAPGLTGRLGRPVHDFFMKFAGIPSFLIPSYFIWFGIASFIQFKNFRKFLDTALFSAAFISLCALISLLTNHGGTAAGLGGTLGDKTSLFLVQQFGAILTFLFAFLVMFVAGAFLARVSPAGVLFYLRERIAQDIAHWKEERQKLSEKSALKKKLEKSADGVKEKPKTFNSPAQRDFEKGASKPPEVHMPKSFTAPPARPPAEKPVTAPIAQAQNQPPQKAGFPAGEVKKQDGQADTVAAAVTSEDYYKNYVLPNPDLLALPAQHGHMMSKEEMVANGTLLEQTLEQFGVKAKVVDIHPGPVITRYDLTPAPGVRIQALENLSNDIAMALKAQSLRVLAPIPGKAAVGFEISNPHPMMVYFKEIILSEQFQKAKGILTLAIGKTTEGDVTTADLASMPHLLIAGATGSGKSVCIHGLILSILFKFRPDEVKLVLIDPKRLELPGYNHVPHIYDPAAAPETVRVITEPKDVVFTLKKLIDVMDDRYRAFAKFGVRNIDGYNEKAKAQKQPRVPYIVVVIDELADLMVVVGKEIEDLIQRLAQMARAVGIHLVLATQRPSVDVITGVIKANLPARIAFQVLSKVDSRVILDSQGAEDLIGKGDMLFLATGAPKPVRLQGAFVTEADVQNVVKFISDQGFKPNFDVLKTMEGEESVVDSEENRRILIRAARVVRDAEKVSGDLLRADKEIGSKYDWALTLLRKKGMIEKPKDTNRWTIHFDRLGEFLAEVEKKS